MEFPAVPTTEAKFVSIPEASRLISRPENTIRDWVKVGSVEGKRDSKGRWLVDRASLHNYVIAKGKPHPRMGATVAVPTSNSPHVPSDKDRLIAMLEDTVDRERRLNSELRAQIRELERERSTHLAEMRAIMNPDKSGKSLSKWIRSLKVDL